MKGMKHRRPKANRRYLLPLALKNLTRYWRRTLITSLALALGLMLYILIDSLLQGAELESERNLIRYETSSAKVMRTELWDDYDRLPIDQVIEEPAPILGLLREDGIAATPRILFPAELVVHRDPYPEDGAVHTRVYAIDPTQDDMVFPFGSVVLAGRYLRPGEDGVLLGSWLAENLGAEVGYPLTLVTRTRRGFRQTVDVEVVGIIECPNPAINRTGVFLPLDTADLYLQMDGAITEIGLQLEASNLFDQATSKLRAQLGRLGIALPTQFDRRLEEVTLSLATVAPNLQLIDWRELAADYVSLAQAKSSRSGIILFLVFIIAAVGVSNTMLMALFERTRELGMMRSLGMPRAHIRILLLIEAAGIGLIGAVGGVILGALVNIPLVNRGFDYSRFVRDLDFGYRVAIFYGTWDITTFILAFVIAIAIAIGVAFFPTRRALRLNIPACLRQ